MGGSAGIVSVVASLVSTLAGGASSRPSSRSVDSGSSALLRQQEKEREETRKQEAEDRRKRQERRTEAVELSRRRLAGLSGRESTLATGGSGLLTRALVETNRLKGKLGQ